MRVFFALVAVSGLTVLPLTRAAALEVAVRVEPGAAVAVGGPSSASDAPSWGAGAVAKAATPLAAGYVDLQAGAGGYALAGKSPVPSQGVPGAVTVGGGARFKRPHHRGAVSPWTDLDLLYVRTGPLDRPGFAAGGGVSFAMGAEQSMWIGPFLRYVQIVQPEKTGFDNTDAKLFVFGVSGELGKGRDHDADRDGVDDDVDLCPDVAGVKSHRGCPVVDGDGDGTPDATDGCPRTAGPRENGGCPYPDADADGVMDAADKCPHQPGPAARQGCPSLDRDGDGFPDDADRCPLEAGKLYGCPDPDGDGLLPPEDHCPSAPGAKEDHGCPRYRQIVVTEQRIELTQKIFFAFGQTTILSQSSALLDEVAQALKDQPTLRVRVEGHTDKVGDAKKNRELSAGRAAAVVEYLVAHGVARGRLGARGFGPDVPLDTNTTAEGRERNRRVEFVIVDDKDVPVTATKATTPTPMQEGTTR